MGGAAVTVTSRLPALIDYLVALFDGAATIGQATPPVTVFDGPPTTLLDSQLTLYVGLSDPESDGPEAAGDSQQTWAALGRRARDEEVTIHCCAVAWSGVDDIATARTAATGIVAAVEVVCQADNFGGLVLFPDPGITGLALTQNNTSRGAIAQVTFDLIFKSRIGG